LPTGQPTRNLACPCFVPRLSQIAVGRLLQHHCPCTVAPLVPTPRAPPRLLLPYKNPTTSFLLCFFLASHEVSTAIVFPPMVKPVILSLPFVSLSSSFAPTVVHSLPDFPCKSPCPQTVRALPPRHIRHCRARCHHRPDTVSTRGPITAKQDHCAAFSVAVPSATFPVAGSTDTAGPPPHPAHRG
jgi:hypothetical protein